MQTDAMYVCGAQSPGTLCVQPLGVIYNLQIDAIIDKLAKNMFCM